MRWVWALVAGLALAGASGCTPPKDESPSTFLLHRDVSTGEPDEDPDGGTLPVYPAIGPSKPGAPVD
jgi:hypothetical protein